jgi:hypothetical protein
MDLTEYDLTRGADLFWSRVARTDDCWPWTLARSEGGYGRTRLTGCPALAAHVVAYVLAKGPIPEGYEIDHLCFNPPCCNPDHLEAVTPSENKRRSRARRGLTLTRTAYVIRRGPTSWQVKWRNYGTKGRFKWRSCTFRDQASAEAYAAAQDGKMAA